MRFICKVARITFCDDVARSSATLEEPGVEERSGGSSFEGIQDPGLIQNSLGGYISQLNWDPMGNLEEVGRDRDSCCASLLP